MANRNPWSPEARARQSELLKAYWADPARCADHGALTRAAMDRPEVRQKISERTRAALANPETRARQRAGLAAVWADPEKRRQQAALTIERMAVWRERSIEAATVVLQQLPRATRERVLANITGHRDR